MGERYRIYGERRQPAGATSGHYFHQDLLVARDIFARKPVRHIDVGSRVDGFVAHVAAFRKIEVVDIRPMPPIQGIEFLKADLMDLPPKLVDSADSVSCLHALEHFGLGRYGDPVDFDGWHKGLEGLTRMVQHNGVLYLSVPTGSQQRIEFNAHRVFSIPFLQSVLEPSFEVESCSFVDDRGDLMQDIDLRSKYANESFGSHYGCSIWTLRKR